LSDAFLLSDVAGFVWTVGLNEEKIRKYAGWELKSDQRMEQLKL